MFNDRYGTLVLTAMCFLSLFGALMIVFPWYAKKIAAEKNSQATYLRSLGGLGIIQNQKSKIRQASCFGEQGNLRCIKTISQSTCLRLLVSVVWEDWG